MPTSRLFDPVLRLLSTFILGVLTGLTTKYCVKAQARDIKSQQITTMLAFVSPALACDVAGQIWRLSFTPSAESLAPKVTGRWKRDDLSIRILPRSIGVAVRKREKGELTAALRREFLPEVGGGGLPSPCETVYDDGADGEEGIFADDEYSPGRLYCDDEESVTSNDENAISHDESEINDDDSNTSLDEDDNPSPFWTQESEPSLQEVKCGYAVLHSGTVEGMPYSAFLEDPDAAPIASEVDGALEWLHAGYVADVDSASSKTTCSGERG